MSKCYIIYKTTNLINGKIYVGQHNTSADDGYLGSGTLLLSAVDLFGNDNFIRESLEFCTSSTVNDRESYWIESLSAIDREVGYNICVASFPPVLLGKLNPCFGKFGKDHPAYGCKHSDESIKIRTQKLKQHIKDHPRTGAKNPNYGHMWNEEQKVRLREKMINRYDGDKNPNAKQYLLTSPDSKIYFVFGGIRNFCKDHGIVYKGRKTNWKGWKIEIQGSRK